MTPREILKQYWGHHQFRPMQEEIVTSVLQGRDTLALLPTGGGKSVCFQVPALAKEGICIVVSPLIALMKDQVENLKARGIAAMAIVSGMGRREVDIALDNCIYGPVKFLYLSPERLLSDLVRERIKYMNVNLFAVDEAHCISQWGYDFRPPYLHIARLRELHPAVPVLALTASATADVQGDIQEKLAFRNGAVFRKSFERKNLSYVVQETEDKLRKLLDVAHGITGSGIVYVRTRKETFEIAQHYRRHHISADYYHAGLPADERAEKQDAWKSNTTRIIVATNAFGMGIDKPDVRFVIHKDMPDSLEAYYQEAGRAGRDEDKAYAVLLYHPADRALYQKKMQQSFPSVEEIKKIYHSLGNYCQLAYQAGEGISFDLDIAEFCSRFELDAIKTLNALKFLEQDEYVSFTESVFLPSRFRFEVLNEELYNFQIQNPGWDPFVKTLLRSYGGSFENYVRIKEFDIARRAGMSVQQVVTGLQQLQAFDILSYLPQTDQPQITWLKPRQPNNHLYINKVAIEQRKATYRKKLDAVFAYTGTPVCRSRQLLTYFDEPEAPKCGICDVCLEERRQQNSGEITDHITSEIVQALSNGPHTIAELIPALKYGTEREKIRTLRLLLDAAKIKTNGEIYYL
ncbi:RecQ family ATP-dependent DNA helicase [Mucilaginibacter sp.]|uniref:RecQ family ATP-dependent DNA helicase n=1 Tax=Mucilaginibacter sp. TaxID=1882438 RepID=UPI000CBE1E14|nr:ATP-dependent DNA helicase RecQ [Mucilaginibacter sp.]PLW88633.1 MAG: RecQ family ATP-dependent DNA helicase [Mucilaginibacter sp.]HEK20787.1 RecQ family ATP-dependent DNA helicase [Bacteroidota bacterium]